MKDELEQVEKIDLVSQRTGLDFGSARSLLAENGWDLLQALTVYEAKKKAEEQELFNKVKSVLKQAGATKIVVKGQEDIVFKLPAAVGVLGAVFAPKLALLVTAGCLLNRCSLELCKGNDLKSADTSGLIDN
ncbi:MAG: DUF4342 domain-containing protein [Firmicutes bacterium]|nr:DUF4342 domain-containing protein [Bacillota bacterium]